MHAKGRNQFLLNGFLGYAVHKSKVYPLCTKVIFAPMSFFSRVVFFCTVLFCATQPFVAFAQPSLPDFDVVNRGSNRIVISWTNHFGDLAQLNVQRSYDGKKFTSVYTAASPELPQNGYTELAKPGTAAQYRIFYVMPDGKYFFSKAKYPDYTPEEKTGASDGRRDQVDEALMTAMQKAIKQPGTEAYDSLINKDYFVINQDTLFKKLNGRQLLLFRDSILNYTRDTLYQLNDDSLLLSTFIPPFEQSTSRYVYTNKDGYIVIDLPLADKKRYDLLLMEEDERKVLNIQAVKKKYFILDKSNFYHGGWYKFELKEDGRILERNRVFLPKDF